MALFEGEDDLSAQNETAMTQYQILELISLDSFLIFVIILPLFLAAMHFYTASFKKRYFSKVQIMVVPLATIPFFFFTNIDIVIMSAIVLLQNGYIAWYTID